MTHSSDFRATPPFRPTLRGCVARDPQFAQALSEVYRHKLYEVAAMTYRSLIADATDHVSAGVFDEIAIDAAEHFRLLGDLILALGSDPCFQMHLGVEQTSRHRHTTTEIPTQMVLDARKEKKRSIDRLQTLMGHTADRVVRSILTHLLTDESRHMEILSQLS